MMTKTKDYPVINFARMQPYPLQREIMAHPARFQIIAFGRQSGKSWLARRMLLEKAANEGMRTWWVAPSIPTAQDHWDELVRLIEESGFPTKGKPNSTTKTIRFLSGGSIRIRSADKPDNLRGGTLDFLVLDEAAFMKEEVWLKILQPTITASRGSVWFLSTPNGQNWFYRLYRLGQNADYPDYQSWTMPSTEAPYQDREMLDVIRRTTPELVWREEYLAEFLADSGGVFAGLDRVQWRPMLFKPEPGHAYVAGVDWGLDDDYTVFTVADKYTNKQVYGARFNSIGTTEQLDRILELIDIWRPETVNIELNGIGYPMFKLLREQFYERTQAARPQDPNLTDLLGMRQSRTRLRGIHIDNARKRKLIERLAAAIEYGRFEPLVARNAEDLESFGAIQVQEMSTFQRKRTVSGLEVTYEAADGYHDDTVTALALCYDGLDDAEIETPEAKDYQAAPRRRALTRTTKRSPFQQRRGAGEERISNARRTKVRAAHVARKR